MCLRRRANPSRRTKSLSVATFIPRRQRVDRSRAKSTKYNAPSGPMLIRRRPRLLCCDECLYGSSCGEKHVQHHCGEHVDVEPHTTSVQRTESHACRRLGVAHPPRDTHAALIGRRRWLVVHGFNQYRHGFAPVRPMSDAPCRGVDHDRLPFRNEKQCLDRGFRLLIEWMAEVWDAPIVCAQRRRRIRAWIETQSCLRQSTGLSAWIHRSFPLSGYRRERRLATITRHRPERGWFARIVSLSFDPSNQLSRVALSSSDRP